MYVRLAFAVAAHLEPEILIVDEVLAVGDAEFQKKCLGKMREVAGRGRTVLFVSHNLAAIERLCGKCVMLDKGRIMKVASATSTVLEYLKTSPAADLELYRDSTYKNRGELLSVEISQQTAEILLSVRTRSAEPRDFAVVIHDKNQNPLFTTHMTDRGKPVTAAGDLTLSVPLPVSHLKSGQYFFSFASFTTNRAIFFDSVAHVPVQVISMDAPTASDGRWGQLCFDIGWGVATAGASPYANAEASRTTR